MAFLRERKTSQRQAGRRAFTLVEILVVMAIIAILVTAVTIASFRALAGARVQQTHATIKKINDMVASRTTSFNAAVTGRNLAGGDTTDAMLLTKYERQLVNSSEGMRKTRLFAKFFGMSFGETQMFANGMSVPGLFGDLTTTELGTVPGWVAANHRPETENPEMLYWFLTKGPTFGSDYQADFGSSEVADTDGDGLLEFIDAWGKPIRFYRWPTRLIRPAPASSLSAPSQGSPYFAIGPDDGAGKLSPSAPASMLIASLPSYSALQDQSMAAPLAPAYDAATTPLAKDNGDAMGEAFLGYATQEAGTFGTPVAAAQAFERAYYTPNTWHAPLIVSAGPDGVLGLFEPTDRTNFGHLAQPNAVAPLGASGYSAALEDNVTNLNGQASTGGGQ